MKFRSLLESRWAKKLDTRRWPWEYEPKRFAIDGARTYTPDFGVKVPYFTGTTDVLVEVKPTERLYLKERSKHQALVDILDEKHFFVVFIGIGDASTVLVHVGASVVRRQFKDFPRVLEDIHNSSGFGPPPAR